MLMVILFVMMDGQEKSVTRELAKRIVIIMVGV